MGFAGKVPSNHSNMRTEFAWMSTLDATHYPLHKYHLIDDYDIVFIIFPKGRVFLSAEGSKISHETNPVSHYLEDNIVDKLKQTNKKVYYIQEGPHWWWNDYEIKDQVGFYNFLSEVDGIFAHNVSDERYYRGLFPDKKVEVIHSLMIDEIVVNSKNVPTEDKVIIGGNFARWYGGFESYIVASKFGLPIFAQDSHAKREHEDNMENLTHLPRLSWEGWMYELSRFKYAVHLMPTVAAGTFSLNCAYLGIPCIGNEKVDTQRILHPNLSVDVDDIESANIMAEQLKDDDFYKKQSELAQENYKKYYTKETWVDNMLNKLENKI